MHDSYYQKILRVFMALQFRSKILYSALAPIVLPAHLLIITTFLAQVHTFPPFSYIPFDSFLFFFEPKYCCKDSLQYSGVLNGVFHLFLGLAVSVGLFEKWKYAYAAFPPTVYKLTLSPLRYSLLSSNTSSVHKAMCIFSIQCFCGS